MRKLFLILFIVLLLLIFGGCSNREIDPQDYGTNCKIERSCGEIVGIDCDAAVDGPYYYVSKTTGEIISRCGGYCMGGDCTNCPPKEWNCEVY